MKHTSRRDAEIADLSRTARLRNLAFPHRQRPEGALLQGSPHLVQESPGSHALLDLGDRQAVHTGRVRAVVARDPVKRHDQRRRVMHEIEQVVEPAAGIGRRPTVKPGLHLRYPRPRSRRNLVTGARIHRRVFRHCSLHSFSKPLPPFPMRRALPGSEYYGGSAPFRADRPTAGPALDPRWQH